MSIMQMLLGTSSGEANEVHFAVTHGSSPYINVYPFDNGIGTKIADPSTAVAGSARAVAFSPDKKFIAVGHGTSPYVSVYHWSNAGFGAKVSNPSTLPTNTVQEVRWSPDGNIFACGHGGSNRPMSFYAWSSSGFGTRFTNPSGSGLNTAYAIRWHPDGDYVLVGGSPETGTSAKLEAYAWDNSTGFGTKYTPSTAPSDKVNGIHFHPDGDYVAVAQAGATVFARTYPWSSSSQFGSNISAPSGKWNDDAEQVQFTAAGNDVAFVGAGTPYVAVWPWTGSAYGTRYSNPLTLPNGFAYGLGIAPDDSAIGVGSTFGDKMQVYPFTSGTGLGTKYANPATLPAGNCRKAAFA
tara:strand:+ start:207 stop:1259 length:1053 start_codon:yes stop_codon:yes gene_type:complete